MPGVTLSGQLVCTNDGEASILRRHLPLHSELSRAEPGCISFEVSETADPYVWQVYEQFVDAAAFEAHQTRVRAGEWGQVTAAIERRYTIEAEES